MQGNINEIPTSQDQNEYVQRIMKNSYHGVLTIARPLTLIERRYHKFMRSYYNNMRERDLYEATHKYEQIISGCTQNTKFDWSIDFLAKMAYYGIDANKLMLLQGMRYPRSSKLLLWMSMHYKLEQLFKDLDNHSTPDLYAVSHSVTERLKIWVPFAYKIYTSQFDEIMFSWLISNFENPYRAKLFELGFDWTYAVQAYNVNAYLGWNNMLRRKCT